MEPADAAPRARAGIGARVVGTVVVLCIIALAVSGVTVYALSSLGIEDRVRTELSMVVDEVQVLADQGIDPRTGEPFTSPRDLLRVVVQRSVLGRDEGEFATVGGSIAWLAPETIPLRLESDQGLLDATLPLTSLDRVSHGDVRTASGDYRYVVIPVIFDAEEGALVRAINVTPQYAELHAMIRNYALIGGVSVLLVGALVWLLLGRLLQPLTLVRRTAQRLSASDLSERIPVRGTDDLAALTVTINDMLDRLEQAVTAQQQLTNDVSHELRTPMTIMRGNLELLDATNAHQVASTRDLLLGVLSQMESLVSDLLTLAHSGRPDFIVKRPTDVAQLTDQVAELARSLGDRTWRLDHLAEVELNLDPDRIQQAMLQLASNAVKYSDDHSTVTIGSRVVGDEVHLYVRDEGIGIAAEDMELVLSRFGRTATARQRGTDGFGLGLAIVHSIMAGHGGRIDVESAQGFGSKFTLVLGLEADHAPDSDR